MAMEVRRRRANNNVEQLECHAMGQTSDTSDKDDEFAYWLPVLLVVWP